MLLLVVDDPFARLVSFLDCCLPKLLTLLSSFIDKHYMGSLELEVRILQLKRLLL